MSDGPHRSPPMRRVWKKLAKQAGQHTYDLEQLIESMIHCLASDFKHEVSGALISALKNVFNGRGNSLRLPEIALDQLETARSLAAGSVFGMSIISWCIQLVHEGRIEGNALYEAVGLAAKERGCAVTRQIGEHGLRESGQRHANDIIVRLESAISDISEVRLGKMLVDPQSTSHRSPRKRTDINEGVPLS